MSVMSNFISQTTAKILNLDFKSSKNAPNIADIADEVQKKLDSLTKPQGSLGRLEELSKHLAVITGRLNPSFDKKLIIVLAADHGVTEENVSAYPKEVTAQMVYNFLNGGAAINVLANHVGADVCVVDVGVASELNIKNYSFNKAFNYSNKVNKDIKNENSDYLIFEGKGSKKFFFSKKVDFGTKNMSKGPAMTKSQAQAAIETGILVAEKMIRNGYQIIGTGDMGIGNTTASSAITACICSKEPELVTGYGTGIDNKGFLHKVDIIKKALKINKPDNKDAIDVLSKIGGFEIGAIAGVILGCAANRVPVVIDGFISGASALIAYLLEPKCRNFMVASHNSKEKGHKIILEYLNLNPLLDFEMRLGEGTGAALAIGICEAAVKILNEMATFSQAGVSQKNI